MSSNIFIKACDVIESCCDLNQLTVALRYVILVRRRKLVSEENGALLFNLHEDKFRRYLLHLNDLPKSTKTQSLDEKYQSSINRWIKSN